MNGKTDKFTAARIRLFTATGMAVQKGLPFDRPRVGGQARMISADQRTVQQPSSQASMSRRHAS